MVTLSGEGKRKRWLEMTVSHRRRKITAETVG
jgi:hypothetical protein